MEMTKYLPIQNIYQLELCRAYTPRARSICSAGSWRPSPMTTYHCRLCTWADAESTWPSVGRVDRIKIQRLRCLWALPKDSKHDEASFSTISTDLLYLYKSLRCLDFQISRFGDFGGDGQTDRTDCFTPCCACAHGVKIHFLINVETIHENK
jgi:hypothetical protein